MNVLVVNFEMDPASRVLAWQYQVARQLALHCRRVVVLTNRVGLLDRPANMEVRLFPRWLFRAPWRLIGGKWWVNVLVWHLCRRHAIDACFIHMNMEWGYRLAPTFAALRVPVLLWYAHGTVSRRLRLAHRCVTRVVTSTPEGFRLPSDKLRVIGQGVNTEVFSLQPREAAAADVITVSRISRRKRIDLTVDAFALLCERQPAASFRLMIVGPALTDDDRLYGREVRARVEARGLAGRVVFLGHVVQEDLPPLYRRAFVHLNLSLTGSMDKSILESLAVGCPVVTSNEALRGVLAPWPGLWLGDDRPAVIAERLLAVYERADRYDPDALRRVVVGQHDLTSYVRRIYDELRELVSHRAA